MKVGNTKRVSCCLHVFFLLEPHIPAWAHIYDNDESHAQLLEGIKGPVQFTCLDIPFVQCISSSGYRAAAADAR